MMDAAAAGDCPPAAAPAGLDAVDEVDVAIVGGGVSGLSVALALSGAGGLRVRVLEARERLGGRLDSVPVGQPGAAAGADLGGTWFWPGEQRVRRLVDGLQLPTHRQHLDGDTMFASAKGTQRMRGNQVDGPAFRFSDGAKSIIDGLAAQLPDGVVRTAAPVTSIRRRAEGGVRLEVQGGQPIHARAVVVALPPSLAMSQAGMIRGEDLAPRARVAAEKCPVWMGSTAKVVAVYPRPFWRDDGLNGAAICRGGSARGLPIGEMHDMSGPKGSPGMLLGFATGGDPALDEDAVLSQLAMLFGDEARQPTKLIIQDWSREAYTSPPNVHALRNYQYFGAAVLQEPDWDGALYWTSTETSSEATGHIEGALAAAERTAGALLQRLT